MSAASPLLAFQMAMGRHVRDPRRAPRPDGVPRRRVAIYNELVFNNLEGLLRPCFPVTRAVLGTRWPRLVRQFCREARCQSPLFREVPAEFLQWLIGQPGTETPLPPWLRELAHYEWAELAVDLMPRGALPPPATPAQATAWDDRVPALNPALMNLAYQWPVHRIGPDFRPRKPLATFMLVYRDRDDAVGFMALNAVSSRLLQLLGTGTLTSRQACEAVAAEMGQPGDSRLIDGGLRQIHQWTTQDIILGAKHDTMA